jgi:hypothetical protein
MMQHRAFLCDSTMCLLPPIVSVPQVAKISLVLPFFACIVAFESDLRHSLVIKAVVLQRRTNQSLPVRATLDTGGTPAPIAVDKLNILAASGFQIRKGPWMPQMPKCRQLFEQVTPRRSQGFDLSPLLMSLMVCICIQCRFWTMCTRIRFTRRGKRDQIPFCRLCQLRKPKERRRQHRRTELVQIYLWRVLSRVQGLFRPPLRQQASKQHQAVPRSHTWTI